MKLFIAIITVLLLTTAMLFISTKAHADDFNYTGNTAENIDGFGWIGGGTGPLGGPGGNERAGLAQQFEIFQDTNMSFLDIHATVAQGYGTINLNYNFYADTTNFYHGDTQLKPIPVVSSLIYSSDTFTFNRTELQDNQSVVSEYDMQAPVNYVFTPGKYWVSEEGKGGAYVGLSQTYIDPPINANHAVPEIPAWACLLFGLFLMEIFNTGKVNE